MDDFSADINTAGVIELGNQVTGALETPTDSDWFAINLVENTTYNFTPTTFGPDIVWSFYDENGVYLGNIVPEINFDPIDFAPTETFSFVAGFTGAAFLGISRPSEQEFLIEEDYSFTIQASTPPLDSPDDFSADANTEAVLALDGVRFQSLQEHVGDSDWLAVTVEAGQTIQFNGINFGNVPFSLTVREADGDALSETVLSVAGDIQGPEQGADEATLIHTFDAAGTYFLDLSSLSTTFTATSVAAFDVQDDFAANSTTIGEIVSGQTINGVIQPDSNGAPDADWIRVELEANQTLTLSLDELPRAGQIIVDFVDANGNPVFNETWRDTFLASDVTQFILTAPETGTYYAVVTSTLPEFPYALDAAITSDDFHDNPNLSSDGVIDDANFGQLIVNDGPVFGTFEHAFDSDAFQITLRPGEAVDFTLTLTNPEIGESTAAAELLISGPDDEFVDSVFTRDGVTSFALGSEDGGTFTIVAADAFLGDGQYSLQVTGQTDDHANSFEGATRVTPGDVTFGATEYDNDIDVFSVELLAGDIVRFDAGWIGGSLDFISQVLDSNGNPLEASFSVFNDQTQLFEIETTGTYFITIEIDSIMVTEPAPFAFLLDIIDNFPIPDSVSAIFGEDYLSWAPIPQIGETPAVSQANSLFLTDDDFTIAQGDTHYIAGVGDTGTEPIVRLLGDSTFVNNGTIWIEDDFVPVFGIDSNLGSHFINNGDFTALATVSAEGLLSGFRDDNGFDSTGSFINTGNFNILSVERFARGVSMSNFEDDIVFNNSGDFSVYSGQSDAYGVVVDTNEGQILNTGNIDVTGYRSVTGIASDGFIINEGSITAISGSLNSIGINSNIVDINNSGSILADIAIMSTTDANIVNSGSITGDIILSSPDIEFLQADGTLAGENTLINSGVINGDIQFGDFDDLYDNHAGGTDGIVLLGGGDDRAISSAGFDLIDGGDGNDTLVFTGDRSDFIVTDLGDGFYEIGSISLRNQVDQIVDIEFLEFNGQSFNILNTVDNGFFIGTMGDDHYIGTENNDVFLGAEGNDFLQGDAVRSLSLTSYEGQLYRAYQAVFDRAPDAAGFNTFLTEMRLGNRDQESVIAEFVESPEFQNTYGMDITNRDFMELLYLNVLDRPGDAAGLNAFTAALDGGLAREAVVVEFANSAEFVNLMALPSAAFATNVVIHPVEAQVFRIFQAVFNRDPDEGGFTNFTNSIQAGVLTVEEITAEFVASPEFQATYGELSNADFVELLFANVLPGNMDQQGRANFTESLDDELLTRAEMVTEFVESFEFVQRMAGPAAEFVAGVFSDSSDTLHGGTGNDVLFGGRGDDEFVFDTATGGQDIILDFTTGTDSIDLGDNAAFDSFAEIIAAGAQVGLDTVFDFGGSNRLTLDNTVLAELTEDDFGLGDDVITVNDVTLDVLI